MRDVYVNPASTVDLIISTKEGILLIKRKNDPFKDHWALPGGFLDNGKEALEEAAIRELLEETGLIALSHDLVLVGVYSNPKRDPRGHVISHAFKVKSHSGKLKADDDAKEAKFFQKLPDKLAFDHAKIINDYFRYREKGLLK